jgi:hypothetical protein
MFLLIESRTIPYFLVFLSPIPPECTRTLGRTVQNHVLDALINDS